MKLSLSRKPSNNQVLASAVEYANELYAQNKVVDNETLTTVVAGLATLYASEHKGVNQEQLNLFMSALIHTYRSQQ